MDLLLYICTTTNQVKRLNLKFALVNILVATIVIGIPTVKRSKESYLVKTLRSLFNSMSDEEKEIVIVVVFIAEVIDFTT